MAQEKKWREQLGLDYLSRVRKKQAQTVEATESSLPPYMEQALIAHGHRVLKALAESPDGRRRLFDLVDELGLVIDTLRPVIRYMEDQGYVETVEVDPKGNHTVRVTRPGRRIAEEA